MIGKDDKPQEGDARLDRAGLSGVFVKGQAQPLQESDNFAALGVQSSLVVGEEQDVIHITQVGAAFQDAFGNLVKFVQIDVGPMLGGEIANRQAARTGGGPEVIAGKIHHLVFFGLDVLAAGQDVPHQIHDAFIAEGARQDTEQDFMVNGGEELAHIKVHDETMPSQVICAAIQGGMRAFALAVGVTVEDELALEERLDDVHQGVMHHAVAEGGSADEPAFWGLDVEIVIRAGAIDFAAQFFLQLEQVALQVIFESRHSRLMTLAARCYLVSPPQIQRIVNPVIEVIVAFAHFFRSALIY